jgi:uncharacterized protein (TIGR03086 family)
MDILTTLERSANATATVARGVRPNQFDSPTPCSEWTVEELMNHLIGSLEYFKARGEGKTPGPLHPAPRTTYDQTVEHLQNLTVATAEAWRRPGALDQSIDTGARSMPGSAMVTIIASELLTHGWDLAKATGQQMPADDVDVDQVLRGMKRSLKPEARQPSFGPEVQPPPDARPIDQLAAFLGRTP